MTPLELAREFVARFTAGQVDQLAGLLTPDLKFRGPLLCCDDRAGYLSRLREQPPEPAEFRILEEVGDEGSAALIWEYRKAATSITVAGHFRIEGDRIQAIHLVFDPAQLAPA